MRVITGWFSSSTAPMRLGVSDGFKALMVFLVMSGVLDQFLGQIAGALQVQFPQYAPFFTSAAASLLLLARLYATGSAAAVVVQPGSTSRK